jgi:hypothetical protein
MIHPVQGKLLYFTIFSHVANEKWSECSESHRLKKCTIDQLTELNFSQHNAVVFWVQIKQAILNITFEDFEVVDAKEV